MTFQISVVLIVNLSNQFMHPLPCVIILVTQYCYICAYILLYMCIYIAIVIVVTLVYQINVTTITIAIFSQRKSNFYIEHIS